MEFINKWALFVGMAVLLVLFFLSFKRKNEFKAGKKVANTLYCRDNPYFKRKLREYKIIKMVAITCCIVALAMSFLLLSRPYTNNYHTREIRNRDIILCIDISSSVDELNMELVSKLKDTVSDLSGERFGIVIFNTSPVMLCPLTDDYDYIISILDELEFSLKQIVNYVNDDSYNEDDFYYAYSYLYDGTLVNNEQRGSSLIGENLAYASFCFPKPQEGEEERTQIIIFSTDNDLENLENYYVTLDYAADKCIENNVLVYGIGTESMDDVNMNEMRAAVEKTGGTFYLEEDVSVGSIVNEVSKTDSSTLKIEKTITRGEKMEVPFYFLLVATSTMIILMKRARL
jgi:hypothetical protein